MSLFVLAQLTNGTDTQTDRQTPHDGIGRAYASHRAAIITKNKTLSNIILKRNINNHPVMDWLVDRQLLVQAFTARMESAKEAGADTPPTRSQTTLKKLHVGLSDDRDRAAEVLESETSGPVSSRTRSKERRVGVDREASGSNDRNGDDDTGPDCNAGATRERSLYWMRSVTLSQWRDLRMGVIREDS